MYYVFFSYIISKIQKFKNLLAWFILFFCSSMVELRIFGGSMVISEKKNILFEMQWGRRRKEKEEESRSTTGALKYLTRSRNGEASMLAKKSRTISIWDKWICSVMIPLLYIKSLFLERIFRIYISMNFEKSRQITTWPVNLSILQVRWIYCRS